jgi:peptidoglycan/xylan/chitin deacetylase (PgdA/CDA1 family)
MNDREHDLLGHGWRWLPPWSMDESTEREHLGYAIETYERVCSRRPLGWNSPYSASDATRRLLLDEGGFLYDSDPCSDDVPYYADCDGRQLLVVPYSKTYNDSRYLASPGFASPRDHLELLTMGLDQLVREQRTAMMTVVVHARWTGQAARAAALRAFLDHAVALPGVAFMRRNDIARWWVDTVPAS